MKIAIISVAYNRLDCLQRQLDSLEQASYPSPVTLVISIDKSNTDEVEKFASQYQCPFGKKIVTLHEKNLGLRTHMLSLGRYLKEFDAIIVLEDDITVSKSFYYYAEACVQKYYNEESIAGISLYSFSINNNNYLPFTPVKTKYDIYLMNCAMSWGQIWMRPQWEKFVEWYHNHSEEFNLEHLPTNINGWPKSSWLKYHIRYCIENNKYFVYPYISFSTNNGDPGVNHHKQADTFFQANLLASLQTEFNLPSPKDIEIKYDGFFQPKYIGTYLGINEDDLCVDLFSEKPSSLYRHYVLSNRLLPYRVMKSFALQLRPIEMNIIYQREGKELFLYDTTVASKPPKAPNRYLAYTYFYQQGFYKARTMIGLSRSIRLWTKLIVDKIRLIIK